MRQIITALLATLAIQVGIIGVGVSTSHATPVCQYEDSPAPCRWDAEKQGNGKGESFTIN